MFNIYEATEKDIPAIIQIAEMTWWPTYSSFISIEQIRYMLDSIYSPEAIANAIASRSQTFLILSDENAPKGFAAFGVRADDHKTYKLHKLYVLPETHGKGYGKKLIEDVKRRVREHQGTRLDLNVNRFNPAKEFYGKMGFTIIKEEDIPIGPYWMNDFVMQVDIA